MNTSKKTLKYIPFIIWVIGGTVLLIKSFKVFNEAMQINKDEMLLFAVVVSAVFVGNLKNRFILKKFCEKNLKRIENLPNPKLYQFYEPMFIFFLLLMITVGVILSRLAEGNYYFLLAIGFIDLAIGTALLSSSKYFFAKEK